MLCTFWKTPCTHIQTHTGMISVDAQWLWRNKAGILAHVSRACRQADRVQPRLSQTFLGLAESFNYVKAIMRP